MPTHSCELDHLVVTAPTLAAGLKWVEETLGVTPQPGGEHQRMGTHNALLRLGDKAYLEVIAPNPAAPRPDRPRWFELDRMAPDARPRLATWVARTTDIQSATVSCSTELGEVETMSRGSLDWLITIPPDGRLPGGGVFPTLIEWKTREHPPARLADQGCALRLLELFHPEPKMLRELLTCLSVDDARLAVETTPRMQPYLVVHIGTRQGLRELGGPPM
jgi:Glyoxalase-like domain